MAMTINTNSTALTAQRNINAANMRTTSSLAKLSSGSRVPSAKDDVAALAVGTKLRAEVQSLQQAQQNVGQGIALLQIADGALDTIADMLTRMKVLAVQSTSGQLGNAERTLIDREYQALSTEVDRIAADTAFNGTTLLSGSTSVSSNINDMAAQNLIGEGFADIEFADNFGNGALKIEYNATGNLMTATNILTNATQTIDIGNTAIAVGQNQQVAFNSLGVTITLSDQFDKSNSISATNTAAGAANGFGAGQIEANSISLTSVTINQPDPADTAVSLDAGRFNDATIEIDGAAATANMAISAFNQDGSATTLNATGVDLATLGTKTVTLDDGNGNAIEIEFNVTEAYTGTGTGGAGNNTIELLELGQLVGANEIEGTSTSFTFKVGTGTDSADDLNVSVGAASFTALAGQAVGNVSSSTAAASELTKLLTAIDGVTSLRATVGAAQSRLEFAGASIAVTTENTLSAQSSMLDVDVSQEMTEFTSSQVLLQAGISMLAQANQQPQLLLSLLQ